MRSNLNPHTGKIPEPVSLGAARSRYEQLIREIAKIDRQLADPVTPTKYPTAEMFDAWRASAIRARRYMTRESEQLASWIDGHPETKLLAEACELLVRLRVDGIELDPDELAVITRVEAACAGAARAQEAARMGVGR